MKIKRFWLIFRAMPGERVVERYFVSFNVGINGNDGVGNMTVLSKKPIVDIEDVYAIQEIIKGDKGCDWVTVINLIHLDTIRIRRDEFGNTHKTEEIDGSPD